ncbi:MAG: hypothetical protein WAN66_26925 [Limnoraphis robusta]
MRSLFKNSWHESAIALLFIISLEVSAISDKTIHLSKPDYDFKKAIALKPSGIVMLILPLFCPWHWRRSPS